MKKGIIFDLDGTLLNTLADLGNSVNRVLVKRGINPHPLEAYNHFVGNGVSNLVKRALPSDYDDFESTLTDFINDYAKNSTNDSVPYEGIIELLNSLNEKDIPIAICTNKKQELTDTILEAYFPNIKFAEVIGDRFDGFRKPNPHYPLMIAKTMNLDPKDILFVGDSDVDMITAHNANMKAIGVSWGFRGVKELKEANADVILYEAHDLWKHL